MEILPRPRLLREELPHALDRAVDVASGEPTREALKLVDLDARDLRERADVGISFVWLLSAFASALWPEHGAAVWVVPGVISCIAISAYAFVAKDDAAPGA